MPDLRRGPLIIPGEGLVVPHNAEPGENPADILLGIQPQTKEAPPPPKPKPKPPRFPTGPASNDPVYKKPNIQVKFGNWLIIAIEILKAVAEARIKREIKEAKEADRIREQQEAADAQNREVVVSDPVEIPQNPDIELPPRPEITPYPSIPRPQPGAIPQRLPEQFPDQRPQLPDIVPNFPGLPRRSPATRPGTQPRAPTEHISNPAYRITTNPNLWPLGSPRPSTRRQPLQDPVRIPTGDPNLTPPNTRTVVSNLAPQTYALPGLNPARCPQPARRCKEDEDTPRDRCYKKLVKEALFPSADESYNWTEIDCLTGREL